MTQKTSACSIQRNQQRAEGSSENLKGVSAVGQSSSLSSAGCPMQLKLKHPCCQIIAYLYLYISFWGHIGSESEKVGKKYF